MISAAPTLPRIAVAAMGGTIAMTGTPETGLQPALTADHLIAAVPQAASIACLEMTSLTSVGSASLGFGDLLGLLSWAHAKADEGYEGIVVTQGTDTVEESAFFFHLCWSRAIPVVFTAAMRGASAVGADGPANILAALITVTSQGMRSRRVAVVLNDVIHYPMRVMKSHTLAVETFTSYPAGPMGMVLEAQAIFMDADGGKHTDSPCEQLAWRAAALPSAQQADVAIVATWPGDDGRLLEAALNAGFGGLVIAGVGAGHCSAQFAQRLEDLKGRVPVVMASRVPFGPTASRTYAYPGSEIHLQQLGVLMSGWLSPQKSRVLLWCLLAAGLRGGALDKAFVQVAQVR
jgi:L-asparaginase